MPDRILAPFFWTVLVAVLSVVQVDASTARSCTRIEAASEAIDLFASSSSERRIKQIDKAELGNLHLCSLETRNGRYKIQLPQGEVWVLASQFRRWTAGDETQRPEHTFEEQREPIRADARGFSRKAAINSAKAVWRQQVKKAFGEEWSDVGLASDAKYGCRVVEGIHHCALEATPRKLSKQDDRGPSLPPDYRQYINVLFATNRVIDSDTTGPIQLKDVSYEVGHTLKLGAALVRVPDKHLIGQVERPLELTIFGFTLYRANEDQKKHFTLRGLKILDRADAIRLLKENSEHSAMVFIHGYNNSFDDAVFKTAQIAFDANFAGVPIAFCWPSKASALAYDYDTQSAAASWNRLLELLRLIRDEGGISKVYVVAHSMGNQILLDALQQVPQTPGNEPALSEIIMASPDVNRDVFIERLDHLKLLAGGLTLYASSADKAMLVSRKKAGGVRAGDVPPEGPLTAAGLDTIDITALGDDPLGLNHGTYSSSRSVLDDIGRLLRIVDESSRPKPGDRSPQLIPIFAIPPTTPPTTRYWKYPQ
jgi:esterase/lipase superfamily enzyme